MYQPVTQEHLGVGAEQLNLLPNINFQVSPCLDVHGMVHIPTMCFEVFPCDYIHNIYIYYLYLPFDIDT